MKNYDDHDRRELMIASRALVSLGSDMLFILTNQKFEDTYGHSDLFTTPNTDARPNVDYEKALSKLMKALGMKTRADDEFEAGKEWQRGKTDQLQREFDMWKESANKDRKTRIETEEALRQRVVNAFEDLHDFIRLMEETDVSHKQREGQFALMHKHLETLREKVLFPIDDIPF